MSKKCISLVIIVSFLGMVFLPGEALAARQVYDTYDFSDYFDDDSSSGNTVLIVGGAVLVGAALIFLLTRGSHNSSPAKESMAPEQTPGSMTFVTAGEGTAENSAPVGKLVVYRW